MAQTDSFGRTNRERARAGLAVFTNAGYKVELHIMGQMMGNPCMELTADEHRGENNDGFLHYGDMPAGIDRKALRRMRENHWKARAK